MKATVISYSLSEQPSSLEEWRANLFEEIKTALAHGADIVLYPELFLLGLSQYMKESEISHYIQINVLSDLQKIPGDHLIVLGSFPRVEGEVIFNSAPVIHLGKVFYQDKLYLTPWEVDFTPGNSLRIFDFKGLRASVLICFDVEQPDLAVKLKEAGVEVILVPSATMNKNGNDRVNRCASARSIELGAVVITSPVVGDSNCDLIDHSEGRQGFFLPAQESFLSPLEIFSDYSCREHLIQHYVFDELNLKKIKQPSSETRPFLTKICQTIKVLE